MTEPLNLMTRTMDNIHKILGATDKRLQEFGVMPYGMKKATPKEQREQYDNLSIEGLANLIQQHGRAEVDNWLGKYMKEGR